MGKKPFLVMGWSALALILAGGALVGNEPKTLPLPKPLPAAEVLPLPKPAPQTLPPPRALPKLEPKLDDDCIRYSPAEFERLLSRLKAEREGLNEDWQSIAKQRAEPKLPVIQDRQLESLLKLALERLEQRQKQPVPILPHEPDPPAQPPHPAPQEPSVKPPQGHEAKSEPLPVTKAPGPADPVNLGHALFRAEKYDEALASFRSIDLKEKRAEERAPIQFLIASCLLHLGKNKEAIEFLRDAANSKEDERTASYAQWQLEMQRWHAKTKERIENIRNRRLAAEKQP